MLTASDIVGLYAIIPTPAKPGSQRLDATNTVDLDESARLVDRLIKDGASGIIALGTTGECATLSAPDYRAFAACVLETVGKRVPAFIGTSALGGHEVAERIRFVCDRGADGTLLGLPMWQPVSTDMAVDFYKEVSSLFPSVAVMIYANARAFRYKFPLEFWEAISRSASTVVAAKFSRPQNLPDLIERTKGRINFVPNEMTVHKFFEQSPATTIACWATAAGMGPAPVIKLMDAIRSNDKQSLDLIVADIAWANETLKPIFGDPEIFGTYNTQVEKKRINAAGYSQSGPCRPPYDNLPAEYSSAAEECGRRWKTLQAKYFDASAPRLKFSAA